MSKPRVVLVIDSARERALLRVGLDMTGRFDVVGTVVDPRDAAFIVGALSPDIALVHLRHQHDHDVDLAEVIGEASPGTRTVLLDRLVANADAELPRPGVIAKALAAEIGAAAAVDRLSIAVAG